MYRTIMCACALAGIFAVPAKADETVKWRHVHHYASNQSQDVGNGHVYFAGHGIEMNGVNYVIPIDAKLRDDRDVQTEGVSYEELLNTIGRAKALRLVILDACRANPFKERMNRTMASRGSTDRGLWRRRDPPPSV